MGRNRFAAVTVGVLGLALMQAEMASAGELQLQATSGGEQTMARSGTSYDGNIFVMVTKGGVPITNLVSTPTWGAYAERFVKLGVMKVGSASCSPALKGIVPSAPAHGGYMIVVAAPKACGSAGQFPGGWKKGTYVFSVEINRASVDKGYTLVDMLVE